MHRFVMVGICPAICLILNFGSTIQKVASSLRENCSQLCNLSFIPFWSCLHFGVWLKPEHRMCRNKIASGSAIHFSCTRCFRIVSSREGAPCSPARSCSFLSRASNDRRTACTVAVHDVWSRCKQSRSMLCSRLRRQRHLARITRGSIRSHGLCIPSIRGRGQTRCPHRSSCAV